MIKKLKISPLSKIVNCIGFSPDGKMCASGSADADVDFLSKAKGYEPVHSKVKEGHSSAVKTLDWSADSETIRTTDSSYEILFTNTKTNKREYGSAYFGSIDWQTESHMIGWPARGIWTKGEYGDGSDINTADVDKKRKLIAIGGSFFFLTLLNSF